MLAYSPSTSVVSARVYSRILTSPWLREALLPHGSVTSPYEILDYQATLTLHDARGARATFTRRQVVRFVEQGVAALLDHLWGEGVSMAYYHNTAGSLAASLADRGQRHLVICLPRPMARGETLAFRVERTAMAAFTGAEEWVETTIDHPIARLSRQVVFPQARPCLRAQLEIAGRTVRLPVLRRPDGRTLVRCAVERPQSHTPYTVRWWW